MKTLNKILNKLEIPSLAVAVSSVALVAFGYLVTPDNSRNVSNEPTSKINYSELFNTTKWYFQNMPMFVGNCLKNIR